MAVSRHTTKLCVEHVASQIQMMWRLRQESRYPPNTSIKYFPSNVCKWLDLESFLSITRHHVARVFSTCFGAGKGESGSRLPDDCLCRILRQCVYLVFELFCKISDLLSRTTDALVVTPDSEVAITIDHHWRSDTSGATRSFLFECQNIWRTQVRHQQEDER